MSSFVLRKKTSRKIVFRLISMSSLIIATTALSGCALVGNRNISGQAFDYSISTAATNTVAANQSQSMPSALNTKADKEILVASAPTKYLPPANIGSLIKSEDNNFANAPIISNSNIVSNDLPALPKPTIPRSSNMPAQSMPQSVPTNEIASVPEKKPDLNNNAYYHKIESGESLFSIARKYNVTVASIVSANGLASADRIGVGQKIAIPGRSDLIVAKAPVKAVVTPIAQAKPAPEQVAAQEPIKTTPVANIQPNKESTSPVGQSKKPSPSISSDKFLWPANGKVIVDFVGSKNTGINISVPEGSAIKAAQSGTVIYVGNAVEGYGNLILIKHENGYVTAYAHLSKITTTKGAKVSLGDKIGLAGQTGSVNSSQLHFELRKGATPVDPLPMLTS